MVRGGVNQIWNRVVTCPGTFMINNPALLCTDCWDAIYFLLCILVPIALLWIVLFHNIVPFSDCQETDDELKLLKYQRRLEEELRRPYLNLSLHQTIYQLTLENNHKLAKQLRKEFKVPDRRSLYIEMQHKYLDRILGCMVLEE